VPLQKRHGDQFLPAIFSFMFIIAWQALTSGVGEWFPRLQNGPYKCGRNINSSC
jgi:hypothetical protein